MAKPPANVLRKLSELLRAMLVEPAPAENLARLGEQHPLYEKSIAGERVTHAEVLVARILDAAEDPKGAFEAVRMVAEYTEGKPGIGAPPNDDGAVVERRLDEASAAHLNRQAAHALGRPEPARPAVPAAPIAHEPTAAERKPPLVGGLAPKPPRPGQGLLDLPKDRARGAQNPGGKPPLAQGPA
jgi:hypothetical protein